MRICLVHAHRPSREVIARALGKSFGAQVVTYSCCEDLLLFPLDHDVFVMYNNFGPGKMRGIKGVVRVREANSKAFIVGVTTMPHLKNRFLQAGADIVLLRAGNEIAELVELVRRRIAASICAAG